MGEWTISFQCIVGMGTWADLEDYGSVHVARDFGLSRYSYSEVCN